MGPMSPHSRPLKTSFSSISYADKKSVGARRVTQPGDSVVPAYWTAGGADPSSWLIIALKLGFGCQRLVVQTGLEPAPKARHH
jgi:hypothetical protein